MVFSVEEFNQHLNSSRQTLLQSHKQELVSIIEVVSARVRWLDLQVATGKLSRTGATETLLNDLRQMKYGNNDYVWAANYRSVLVSHPDPTLDQADYAHVRDVRGNLIVPPMVADAHAHGSGFYSYWRRLGQTAPVEKLSYYRDFPSFKLVVGSGVYLDDVESAYQKQRESAIEALRQRLRTTRLAQTGYLYVFDAHTLLIHPNPDIEGKKASAILDPVSGQPITTLLAQAADRPEGLRYLWDRPDDRGHYVYDKISWVRSVPALGWYVCSSVYEDELKGVAFSLRQRILLVFCFVFILNLLAPYSISRHFIAPLKRLIGTARQVGEGDLSARTGIVRRDEIGVAAAAFDGMVAELVENIQNLDQRVTERTRDLSASNLALLEQSEKRRQSEQVAHAERGRAMKALAASRAAAANLSASEQRFRSLFEGSAEAFMLLNETGFTDCNGAALRLFGVKDLPSFMSLNPAALSPPKQPDGRESVEAAQEYLMNVLEKGSVMFEWVHRRADNSYEFPAEVLLNRVHGADGEGVVLQAVVRDISQRKTAEAALLRAHQELRLLAQAKSDFVSTVSLEMRTPMTSVVGFAKLAKKRFIEWRSAHTKLPVKRQSSVIQAEQEMADIVEQSEQLTQLINHALDSATIAGGGIEWLREATDIAPLIAQVVATLQPLAAERGLQLVYEAEALPEVKANAQRIHQVLVNLLVNAIHHTTQGRITVTAAPATEGALISVRDSGKGIATKRLANIFDKFQSDAKIDDEAATAGLGLAICRQIVEGHGGRIWAESTLGRGSVFSFILPWA